MAPGPSDPDARKEPDDDDDRVERPKKPIDEVRSVRQNGQIGISVCSFKNNLTQRLFFSVMRTQRIFVMDELPGIWSLACQGIPLS